MRHVAIKVYRKLHRRFPKPLMPIIERLSLLRVGRRATTLLGRQYRPNPRVVEIDITHRCQLSCLHCNRSCGQARSREDMSVEQIRRFIGESVAQRRLWENIVVLGGEPTLHPQFIEILDLLMAYRRTAAPLTQVTVKSNGHGGRTAELLAKVPPGVVVENSAKQGNLQTYFATFNIAPIDLPAYAHADYRNGCCLCAQFGMGLNRAGYYPCAVAGGIDRVMGFDVGRKSMPAVDDSMADQMALLCRYCGHFKRQTSKPEELNEMSPFWKEAYSKYSKNRPPMGMY